MKTLHALLFAIDNYPNPAHRLAGCRNDLAAIDAFLDTYCHQRGITYRKLIRTDGEVTRGGFAQGFRHFDAAKDGDIALLFYGGHGSRMPAPRQFWSVDPDRYLETIVCYDSRQAGGRDLTDKEVSHLIAEATADRDLHFVAVFDCCHSGTLSRNLDARERRLEPLTRAPEFSDLLGSADFPAQGASDQRLPPAGRHIALSAARSYQTAKELTLKGKRRGIFTTMLVETLEEAGDAPLSYQALIQRVRRKVETRVDDQHPQLDAYAHFDLRSNFLGTMPSAEGAVVRFDPGRGWVLPFGQIHQLDPEGPIHLRDPEGGTREARIDRMGPDSSTLELMRWADEKETYSVLSFAQTTARVGLALHPTLAERQPEAAKLLGRADWPDQLIEFPVSPEAADYWLDVQAPWGAILTRPNDTRPLFEPPHLETGGSWQSSLNNFVDSVTRVANWQRNLAWHNPVARLDPTQVLDVQFERLQANGQPQPLDPTETANFEYVYQNGKWMEPSFRLRVGIAARDQPLWVGALYFSEDFMVTDQYLPMREVQVDDAPHPFCITQANGGRVRETIPLVLPDEILAFGQTSIFNRIKLVVSTQEINLQSFCQKALKLPGTEKSILGFLFGAKPEATPDWATLDLDLRIHRPQEGLPLEEGKAVSLHQVTIEAPEGFRAASIRLSSSVENARSLGVTPPSAMADGRHLLPFDLGGARNLGDPLDVIEMHGALGSEHVNQDHPIHLRLGKGLGADSTLLPMAYDQEDGFFMPLGFTDAEGVVHLETLPAEGESTARGFGKSLKIYLQQFIHTKIKKKEAPYPILAAAEGPDEEAMIYVDDPPALRQRVAAANCIMVLVHGLVGDTSDKRNIIHRARRQRDGHTEDLGSVYDLLLCFDYESLGTSIEDNARSLRDKLEDIDLKPGHGKRVVLVAHSMGGLVSRWFLEREGGHELISCFVQVGSPNLGSPWARVYDWTTFALGKAMNFLPIPGFVNELLGVVGKLREGIELSSMQMLPDSPFLKNLNANPFDPGIPYYLVGGDSERLHDPGERQKKFLRKFLNRFQGGYRDKLERWLFKGEHDDIVALDSIYGAPDFRKSPVKKIGPLACHHFSYFIEPEAVEALGELLFKLAEGGHSNQTS